MATLSVSTDSPAAATVDVLVIAVSKGADGPLLLPGSEAVDSALGGGLSAVLADLGAGGDEGEVTRIASLGAGGTREKRRTRGPEPTAPFQTAGLFTVSLAVAGSSL